MSQKGTAVTLNAGVIGLGSTMVGQLSAGASFDEAFQAGMKAGVVSAVAAGAAYGVNDYLGLNPTGVDATGKLTYSEAAMRYYRLSAVERLGTGTFWAQASSNAVTRGVLAQAQGGKFATGMVGGLAGSLGGLMNSAVGDWARQNGIADGALPKAFMHAGIGAIQAKASGNDPLAGAIGGASAEFLSPLVSEMDKVSGSQLGGQLLVTGTSLAANALLNKKNPFDLTAAYQGLQTDGFNRQLHVKEKQWIQEQADGDSEKEARFTAAACYLVKCYAEYEIDSLAYRELKNLADIGASDALAAERWQLQQSGLFTYTTAGLVHVNDKLKDSYRRFDNTYHITTRTLGAVEALGGGAGMVASVAAAPAACSTGLGCLATTTFGTMSADALYTGSKQLFSGRSQATIFNQALQELGLSPQAASYAELAFGLGSSVTAGRIATKAWTQVSAGNSSKVADELAALGRIRENPNGLNLAGKTEHSVLNQQMVKDLRAGKIPGKPISTKPNSSREVAPSLNPNATAEDFAQAVLGRSPTAEEFAKGAKMNRGNCPGCWIAQASDKTSVVYRPAGNASSATLRTTATVEISNRTLKIKLKFPLKGKTGAAS